MPRRSRHYISGRPYHLVQRGNNREACFIELEDYRFYLALWREVSRRYDTAVNAYCPMTNHIHFLATPGQPDSLSNTMRVVGSRYAQHINRKYRRTGTLWEGRHKASLVKSERYLLNCYRYIELNPVRAGMVNGPEEYSWSSYRANAGNEPAWLVPHDEYLRLGSDRTERSAAYRALFRYGIDEDDLHAIRKASHYNQPLGDRRFRQQLERNYGVRVGRMSRGRPRKRRNEN